MFIISSDKRCVLAYHDFLKAFSIGAFPLGARDNFSASSIGNLQMELIQATTKKEEKKK